MNYEFLIFFVPLPTLKPNIMSPRKKIKRRYRRRFLLAFTLIVLILAVVRQCHPAVLTGGLTGGAGLRARAHAAKDTSAASSGRPEVCPPSYPAIDWSHPHPVYSVSDYDICFPDSQAVQLSSAQRWGVRPVYSREETERLKHRLTYIGSSPYYYIDSKMEQSLPYLVPRAANLLARIGRNFLDSLAVKQLPLHRIIVSSVWRTQSDVESLTRGNMNATQNSCHQYATTFDILYNRYALVTGPRATYEEGNDMRLKFVLSEVLRDLREAGLCYVKHEKGQPCFHITVR